MSEGALKINIAYNVLAVILALDQQFSFKHAESPDVKQKKKRGNAVAREAIVADVP